ncbi:hypothetical protein Scep_017455 [Stephania cephalantha]|uniref:Uncharacterized protein n=1 Tax=Stephania cephalantha TaxID=152367 RepID=A0AAP0NTJ9_9MAGN
MWNASVVYSCRALGQKLNREGPEGEEINTPLHGRNEELCESEGRLPPNASKERKSVTEVGLTSTRSRDHRLAEKSHA